MRVQGDNCGLLVPGLAEPDCAFALPQRARPPGPLYLLVEKRKSRGFGPACWGPRVSMDELKGGRGETEDELWE